MQLIETACIKYLQAAYLLLLDVFGLRIATFRLTVIGTPVFVASLIAAEQAVS